MDLFWTIYLGMPFVLGAIAFGALWLTRVEARHHDAARARARTRPAE